MHSRQGRAGLHEAEGPHKCRGQSPVPLQLLHLPPRIYHVHLAPGSETPKLRVLPKTAVGKAATLGFRSVPWPPMPQTRLGARRGMQLQSDPLSRVMPDSPLIGQRTPAATALLPSILCPSRKPHPEREPHPPPPFVSTQLHTPPPGFPIPQLLAPSPHHSSRKHAVKRLHRQQTEPLSFKPKLPEGPA